MFFLPRWVPLFCCSVLVSLSAAAQVATGSSAPLSGTAVLELRVAVPSDARANYFIRLLEQSLQLIRQPYHVRYEKDLPARRMWSMLGNGDINLFYGVQTKDKDRSSQIVPVRNGLTNGLIGQRVFLIRPGDEHLFAPVASVNDLRRTGLVAGFGATWVDARIWRAAGLPVYEHVAPWGTVFAMVAAGNRHVDYLPRGVIEVMDEVRAHPELAVEPHLLIEYPEDFVFYLASSAVHYRPILERALKEAEATGLKARLLQDTFGPDIKALGLERRVHLRLSGLPD